MGAAKSVTALQNGSRRNNLLRTTAHPGVPLVFPNMSNRNPTAAERSDGEVVCWSQWGHTEKNNWCWVCQGGGSASEMFEIVRWPRRYPLLALLTPQDTTDLKRCLNPRKNEDLVPSAWQTKAKKVIAIRSATMLTELEQMGLHQERPETRPQRPLPRNPPRKCRPSPRTTWLKTRGCGRSTRTSPRSAGTREKDARYGTGIMEKFEFKFENTSRIVTRLLMLVRHTYRTITVCRRRRFVACSL